jgi:bis(5'-nucleosyl)-tetraphosphatase (symmetrical)
MATAVVGDVHGCGLELSRLLARLDQIDPAGRVIFVGDLLTKGPEPGDVIREIHRRRENGRRIDLVCGNHDLRMLAALASVQSGGSPSNLGKTERETWHRLAHDGTLRLGMRLMVECTEHPEVRDSGGKWTVVHGGIDPAKGLKRTQDDVKIHIKALEGEPHWWERYDGSDGLIIVGHKPLPKPLVLRHDDGKPYVVNVDTGCVYGGALTAYIIENDQLVAIAAIKRGEDASFAEHRAFRRDTTAVER